MIGRKVIIKRILQMLRHNIHSEKTNILKHFKTWSSEIWTDSCYSQNGSLSLSPLSLLFHKAICSIRKEHHVFFTLNLSLQELKPCVVETQHILRKARRISEKWWSNWDSKHCCKCKVLTLISRTLEIVLVLNSSMTDRSIWLLVIWPKWILQENTNNKII